jgi:CheY-like chemotaxis protein
MKRHIFLIDDDEDEFKLFDMALAAAKLPYKCTWAENGERALQQLLYIKPDIIFLDLNIPGSDAFACLSEIKRSAPTREIPIVLYSSLMSEEAAKKAKQLGAVASIRKPDSFAALTELLKNLFYGVSFTGDQSWNVHRL